MSGVSIMGRQVGGACHAGQRIGLSHSGTRLLPALGGNLIVNPGFETGDLTGWTLVGRDGNVVDHHRSSVNAPHSGRWWFVSQDSSGIRQRVEVEPGSVLRLSLWRAEGAVDNGRFGMATVTADDASTLATMRLTVPKDVAWHEWTCDFDVPDGVTAVTVTITGNAWIRIDDVSVRQII